MEQGTVTLKVENYRNLKRFILKQMARRADSVIDYLRIQQDLPSGKKSEINIARALGESLLYKDNPQYIKLASMAVADDSDLFRFIKATAEFMDGGADMEWVDFLTNTLRPLLKENGVDNGMDEEQFRGWLEISR